MLYCCGVLQVMKYVFSGQPELRQKCEQLLRVQPGSVTPEQLLEEMLQQVTDSGVPEGRTLHACLGDQHSAVCRALLFCICVQPPYHPEHSKAQMRGVELTGLS